MSTGDQHIEETFHPLGEVETDPNGKLPHEPGAKLDVGKAPVFQGFVDYFPRAMMAIAEVSQFGASKYAWKGWESVPNGAVRYKDAEARHALYASMGEVKDPDSGLLHEAHRVWNALASLELKLREENKKEQIKGSIDLEALTEGISAIQVPLTLKT